MKHLGKRIRLTLAALLLAAVLVATPVPAFGQVVTYYQPSVTTVQYVPPSTVVVPTQTYYQPVTVYYQPQPQVVEALPRYSFYTPTTVSYYAAAPAVTYYAPAPTVSYYTPVTVYSPAVVPAYSAAVTTTYRRGLLFPRQVTTTYYTPAYFRY